MSIQTWLKEFYVPVEYKEGTNGLEETQGALHKWKGLRVENLAKNFLDKSEGRSRVYETSGRGHLCIDSETCALCYAFSCETCPLATTLGKFCDDDGQPYAVWRDEGDPEPMIKALEETIARLEGTG